MAQDDTLRGALVLAATCFSQNGIDTPRLDAEVLLAHVVGRNRIYLHTHGDVPLTFDETTRYNAWVKRRANREPVAYILGHKEFYSREFLVDPNVLVPRPETEHVVEAALHWLHGRPAPSILDIGTGSGAIAIVLACEIPQATVIATDISEAALTVARQNAKRHGVAHRIEFRCGDLFAPIGDERFDVIVSNPPYIELSAQAHLQPEVRDFEPPEALFSGALGLDHIERCNTCAADYLKPGGAFIFEHGCAQVDGIHALMQAGGHFTHGAHGLDLQQHSRVMTVAPGAITQEQLAPGALRCVSLLSSHGPCGV